MAERASGVVVIGGGAIGCAIAWELVRRGWLYAVAWIALAAGTPVLALLWMLIADPLIPRSWIGLVIVFVLHQLFMALRIWLRLAQLGASQGLLLATRAPAPAPPRPAAETPA